MSDPELDRVTETFLSILISAGVGFVFMFPMAVLFERMNWPYFNYWAMQHGAAFVIAWPILTFIAYATLRRLRRKNSK
jgi:hypothetical protein